MFRQPNRRAACETAFGRPKDELLVYKANILAKVLFLFFLLACPNNDNNYFSQFVPDSSIHSAEKAEFVRAEYQEINTFLGQSKKYPDSTTPIYSPCAKCKPAFIAFPYPPLS